MIYTVVYNDKKKLFDVLSANDRYFENDFEFINSTLKSIEPIDFMSYDTLIEKDAFVEKLKSYGYKECNSVIKDYLQKKAMSLNRSQ